MISCRLSAASRKSFGLAMDMAAGSQPQTLLSSVVSADMHVVENEQLLRSVPFDGMPVAGNDAKQGLEAPVGALPNFMVGKDGPGSVKMLR